MVVGCETITVELVQTILRGYPHVAVLVLTHGVDEAAGETVGGYELSRHGRDGAAEQDAAEQ